MPTTANTAVRAATGLSACRICGNKIAKNSCSVEVVINNNTAFFHPLCLKELCDRAERWRLTGVPNPSTA